MTPEECEIYYAQKCKEKIEKPFATPQEYERYIKQLKYEFEQYKFSARMIMLMMWASFIGTIISMQ